MAGHAQSGDFASAITTVYFLGAEAEDAVETPKQMKLWEVAKNGPNDLMVIQSDLMSRMTIN